MCAQKYHACLIRMADRKLEVQSFIVAPFPPLCRQHWLVKFLFYRISKVIISYN